MLKQKEKTHPIRVIQFHVLIIVREGRLDMYEGDQEFHLHKHQYLYLKPGIEHGGLSDYSSDLSFYWFHFTLDGDQKKPHKQGHFKRPEMSLDIASRLLDEQERDDTPKDTLNALLYLLLLECSVTQDQQQVDPNGLVDIAQLFIHDHFHESISTREVAEHCACHPDHLGRLFHKRMGISVSHFIREHRLRKARSLLRDTDLSIEDIARASGFSESHYFRRCFKEKNDLTPSVWRRMHRRQFIN